MSKLYTEEQMYKFALRVRENMSDGKRLKREQIIQEFTPIELPSEDECIHKGMYGYASNLGDDEEDVKPEAYSDKQIDRFHGFVDGAEWVIKKIQGGNNE